jgi:hypothetical protein
VLTLERAKVSCSAVLSETEWASEWAHRKDDWWATGLVWTLVWTWAGSLVAGSGCSRGEELESARGFQSEASWATT